MRSSLRNLATAGAVIALVVSAQAFAAAPAAVPPAASGEAVPLAETVPSDLPRNARPSHYRIEVTPDAKALTFSGIASIDLTVFTATDALTLHGNGLAVSSASLVAANGVTLPLQTSADENAQTLRFAAGKTLAPGKYRLDVTYAGKIGTQPSGFFALDYPDKRTGAGNRGEVRGLFTQFEAPDARRFVPSFDEPSYKATFDLSAVVPADRMAISNMPVKGQEMLAGGLKRVTFGTTPKMSSYLLFFGVGDFERTAKKAADGVDVASFRPRAAALRPTTRVTASPRSFPGSTTISA
jgi:aminopeptidase N